MKKKPDCLGVTNLLQPAKDWLADAVENCGGLLERGEDPSFTIEAAGVEMEIRINKIPGRFQRTTIALERKP